MKLKIFLLLGANLLLATSAEACGPFNPIIPTPPYFVIDRSEALPDYVREENLRLWQSQTSDLIPLGDIEQVVYRDSQEIFMEMTDPWDKKATQNMMYNFLNNSDNEAIEFLTLAKGLEEARDDDERRSPWYYPSSRYGFYQNENLDYFVERAMKYDGEKLKERYAMQACRALFASNQYERCIAHYDSIFGGVDDSSLMKRMAGNYAGGSWARLGDTEKANVLFARGGDLSSLSVENPIEYMLDMNPDAPQIIDYMRQVVATDSTQMAEYIPLAKKALAQKTVTYKGDWGFYMAYFYNHYANDTRTAKKYIRQALNSKFSSESLKDQARAYQMKLDGWSGNKQAILANLQWLDEKCDLLNPEATNWNRRRRNIIYVDWIPQLWKCGDYATAILLADFADSKNKTEYYRKEDLRPGEMDRGSLTFQMMGSLRSDQLAATQKAIMASTPLYNYLRGEDIKNPNLFYDLIGTLALRERNYARAISYLGKVDSDYQRSMKLFREGYLGYNPFAYYHRRWEKEEWDEWVWYYDNSQAAQPKKSIDNIKLEFARQMLDYQKQMKSAPTSDDRGWARLMYALGRRNSFEQCWALTQYWRGFIEWRFTPQLEYWSTEFFEKNYDFLYNYTPEMAIEIEQEFEREIEASMKMMKTDEMRARAEYALCNLKTIAKKYPHTELASRLKTSCDNWKDWI